MILQFQGVVAVRSLLSSSALQDMRIVFEKTSVSGVGSLKAWLRSWELPLASQGHANRDSLAKTGASSI